LTDELVFLVDDCVKLESEFRFRTILGPRSVPASPSLRVITKGLVCRGMALIGCDERRILDSTALDRVPFLIQLPLEFLQYRQTSHESRMVVFLQPMDDSLYLFIG